MVEFLKCAWEWVGDNAAAIIAFCALALTIYQAFVTRRHNRMAIRPLLSSFVGQVSGPDSRITYSLTNNGLGPALIDSFEVTLDGAPVNVRATTEVNEILSRLLQQHARFTVGFLGCESNIRKDEVRQLFDVQFLASSPAEFEGIVSRFNRVRVVVHYHSLYNDRYVFDSAKG